MNSRHRAALILPLALVAACSGSSHSNAVKGVATPSPAPTPVASLPAELSHLPLSDVYLVTARQDISYSTLAGELAAVAKLPGVVSASIQKGHLQVMVRRGLELSRRIALLKQLAAVGIVSVPAAKK